MIEKARCNVGMKQAALQYGNGDVGLLQFHTMLQNWVEYLEHL